VKKCSAKSCFKIPFPFFGKFLRPTRFVI
jgi:hypothetical protein